MKKIELNDLVYELVSHPFETLSPKEIEEYRRGSVPAAREGFGFDGITESDVELHALKTSTTVFVREKSGGLLGFSSSDVVTIEDDVPVIYLQGTVLAKAGQRRGVYNVVNPLRILTEMTSLGVDEALVGTRTQNPVVFKNMVRKLGLFPQPERETPELFSVLAKSLAQVLYDYHSDFKHPDGLQFDEKSLVARMAYGKLDESGNPKGICMYGTLPWADDDEVVNEFLRKNVDFQNGDAMILLGKVSCETVRDSLEREGIRIN